MSCLFLLTLSLPIIVTTEWSHLVYLIEYREEGKTDDDEGGGGGGEGGGGEGGEGGGRGGKQVYTNIHTYAERTKLVYIFLCIRIHQLGNYLCYKT